MRKLFILGAAAATVLGATLASPRAEAMTMSVPAGLNAAIQQGGVSAQDVAYICRPVRHCGYYGCGWRRACWWSPGPAYWGYGFGYYRPYRYAWGGHWRHRHWR